MHAAAAEREAALRLAHAACVGRLDHHCQHHRLACHPPTLRAHCGRVRTVTLRARKHLPATSRRRLDVFTRGNKGRVVVTGDFEAHGGLHAGCAACLRGEVDGDVEVISRALYQRTRREVEHEAALARQRESQVVHLIRVKVRVRVRCVGVTVGLTVRVIVGLRVRVSAACS